MISNLRNALWVGLDSLQCRLGHPDWLAVWLNEHVRWAE